MSIKHKLFHQMWHSSVQCTESICVDIKHTHTHINIPVHVRYIEYVSNGMKALHRPNLSWKSQSKCCWRCVCVSIAISQLAVSLLCAWIHITYCKDFPYIYGACHACMVHIFYNNNIFFRYRCRCRFPIHSDRN